MANPFDEFDTKTNPFDTFDDPEPALDKAGKALKEFIKNFAGGPDAALAMLAGMPGYVGGGVAGLGTLAMTGDSSAAAAVSQDVQQNNFGLGAPKPLSEAGQQTLDMLGEGTDKLKDAAGMAAYKAGGGEGGRANAEFATEAMLNFLPIPGGKAVGKMGHAIEKRIGIGSEDAAALKGLKDPVGETAKKNPFDKFDAEVAKSVADMHDQSIVDRLKSIDAGIENKRVDDYVKSKDAQQSIEARQAQMEAEVRDKALMDSRQRLLQQSAEERARQEAAPVLPDHEAAAAGDRAMGDTAERLGSGERDGANARLSADIDKGGPMYVDPQGQAFKGDPREEGARNSLEAQTKAYDEHLTNGTEPVPGQPLSGLIDPAKPIRSGVKGGKQRGATTLHADLYEAVKRSFNDIDKALKNIQLHDKTTHDAIPTMKELYEKSGNPDVISFARKEYRDLGYPRDVLNAFDKAITAAHQVKLAEHAAKVIPFRPRVPLKEQGGITTDLLTLGLLPKKNPIHEVMKAQKDGTHIPDDLSPEEFNKKLEQARGEKDNTNSSKLMGSGAVLEAMKRGSTAIGLMADLIGNSFKRADLAIRNDVFHAERALRQLRGKDLETLAGIFKKEMFAGERFSRAELDKFSPKMLNAYRHLREMFESALKRQNEAREARGQKAIKPIEAYLSSRWQGDFRRPLYDTEGKLVWYLAGESKKELNRQTRAVLRDHPDLVYDPKKDHTVRYTNGKTDLDSAYTTMIDILGRDDPALEKMQKYMEDQDTNKGASFLGQEKHFKTKGNVRGFIGDRPAIKINDLRDWTVPIIGEWTVGKKPRHEALDMLQQQIQYAKNAMRWSELQKVGDSVKKLLNDPELRAKQPSNVNYMRDYWKNAIGYGESQWTRAVTEGLHDFGVSSASFDRGVSGLKSFFILEKLGASVGFIMTQGIQLGMILPHMADLAWKGKFVSNPLKAIASGLVGGVTMGTGHTFNAMTGGHRFEGIPHAEFFNSAYKYAEDNGITARSIYDESPIKSSFSATGQLGKAVGKTLTVPETYIRSAAFMTLAQFLKDSGKYATEKEIFQEAERRTNVGMVDYAPTERPMLFSKLGSAGNMLNTLQTYSWNYYNQASYFAREARHGNVLPVATFLAFQYLVAGLNGIPGVEDAYKTLMFMKDHLPAKQWKQVQDNEFFREPKLWMLKHAGTSSVYGYLADKTGLGLTARLSAPGMGQMVTAPGGPILDAAKQAVSVGKAALNPNSTTLSQAAMDLTPPGVQGLLDTSSMMEGHTYNSRPDGTQTAMRSTKLDKRSGLISRTPDDIAIRKFGLRSTNEVLNRDVNYALNRDKVAAQEKSKDLIDAFYDAARRGNKQDASEMFKTYVFLNGKGISKEQFNAQLKDEFFTDYEKGATSAKKSIQSMLALKRAQEIYDAVAKEHQK